MDGQLRRTATTLRSRGGFTLLELLVVIIILGILVSIAIPVYTAQTMRAYTREAQTILKQIQSAERRSQVQTGNYVDVTAIDIDLDGLGLPNTNPEPVGNFSYAVAVGPPATATATGRAPNLVVGDTVQINLNTGAFACTGRLLAGGACL